MVLAIRKCGEHRKDRNGLARRPESMHAAHQLIYLFLYNMLEPIDANFGKEETQGSPSHAMEIVMTSCEPRVWGAKLARVLLHLVPTFLSACVKHTIVIRIRYMDLIGSDAHNWSLTRIVSLSIQIHKDVRQRDACSQISRASSQLPKGTYLRGRHHTRIRILVGVTPILRPKILNWTLTSQWQLPIWVQENEQ